MKNNGNLITHHPQPHRRLSGSNDVSFVFSFVLAKSWSVAVQQRKRQVQGTTSDVAFS